jgi:hypothetical protein
MAMMLAKHLPTYHPCHPFDIELEGASVRTIIVRFEGTTSME